MKLPVLRRRLLPIVQKAAKQVVGEIVQSVALLREADERHHEASQVDGYPFEQIDAYLRQEMHRAKRRALQVLRQLARLKKAGVPLPEQQQNQLRQALKSLDWMLEGVEPYVEHPKLQRLHKEALAAYELGEVEEWPKDEKDECAPVV